MLKNSDMKRILGFLFCVGVVVGQNEEGLCEQDRAIEETGMNDQHPYDVECGGSFSLTGTLESPTIPNVS